jgi:hypothetical protein
MKTTKRLTGVVAIAMALVLTIAFSGVALAGQTVPKTPETEIFDITTNINCSGSVMENEELSWKSSSKNLLDIPPLAPGEVYGQIKYDENMIGLAGAINFTKDFNVDTGTAPNLGVMKTIGYTGQGLSHDEQVGMKLSTKGKEATEEKPLCPFHPAEPATPGYPGSYEEVNAYSTLVVTNVAATTMTKVGITVAPVNLLYKIDAEGTGTVAAGVSAFVADGRGGEDSKLGSRLSYREKSIAYGNFEFYKSIGYTSNQP